VSLPRLRLEKCARDGDTWLIDDEQAHHLVRVRRCYNGSLVEGLLDGEKVELRLICDKDAVRATEISREAEPPVFPEIHLFLALLKSDQFDDALRFACETGVHSIHLLSCERSVPKYSIGRQDDKMSRWNKILNEATKQAGSTRPPILHAPCGFDEFDFSILPRNRFAAMLRHDAAELRSLPPCGSLAVAIGPEGDWAPSEAQKLLDEKFIPVSLGKRILRASTAVAVACGWFMLR